MRGLYFGDGDECHMAFHFPLMPRLFMALKLEDAFPIADIVRQTSNVPETCQWAVFLRNHDELTLSAVTDEERVRRRHPAFGRGTTEFLECGNRRALAFVRRHADEALVVVANLAASPQLVSIQLPSSAAGRTAIEIIDGVAFPTVGPAPYTMTLAPYACHWLQLAADPTARPVPAVEPHA